MSETTDITSDTTNATSVHLSIEVGVPVDRAFQVFTQRFDAIKPRHHNLMPVEIVETVLEPWTAGRVYDRGVDGTICQWGRVLAVDAPTRIVLAWDISPHWELESDPSRSSEVEITFTSLDDDRTRVEIDHRHLDRHGDGWESERDAVADADGWPRYVAAYASLIAPPT
jgi:uncharacterized protein YndB with AHSA1/START domain